MSVKSNVRRGFENAFAKSPNEILDFTRPYEVVSLDIFDTLIYRDLPHGESVSDVVDKECSFDRLGAGKYCSVRQRAEKLARRKMNAEEITFNDIMLEVKNLVPHISDAIIDELQACELAVEKRVLTARQEMLNIFNQLKENKRICLISDMYLGRVFIQEVLTGCGFSLDGVDVFVSCELGVTKRTGRLFSAVELDKQEAVCHIGDNLISDFVMPRKLGIASFLVRREKCRSI